ncbi:class I SAM-dependent DNA methyltransferase [Flavobacterium saccharophilum]|uniref:site-specific DNA-methyltransferase (adenine-specific) n=1 Tax=Flavobacterium saccharophilum TaxID=29534 RepID=A0A1M7FL31_9FLAO|nr:N-6 DNA methylase [Flavobacterium saccharophilum]SHM04690.1 type I restriction enzyme M protein [Flavobacterium saccharophilum]
MLNQEIKNKINQLWDLFWSGGMANPLTALEQISYLLFMKRAEDVGLVKEKKYKWSIYTSEQKYKADLPTYMKEVFNYIKNLYSQQESFAAAMEGAEFRIEKLSLLNAAIELINVIYAEADKEREEGQYFQDTLGDFYELILKQTSEAGKNGQFRTPRHIIQLMCEILQPTIDDTICDVTAGTSGFLVGAYQYIISQNSDEEVKIDENGFPKRNSGNLIIKGSKKEEKLTKNTFFGYDIDTTMIRLGMMNLLMHNIKEPKIKHIDSISEKFDEIEKGTTYSKILANPPFTGRIDSLEATTSSKIYKPIYKDGKRAKQIIQSEILFLERIIQLLKVNGQAAVIVPEGVLFGSARAATSIRELLLNTCSLDAVISLPSGVFMPYTGVKTSILVFTKKKTKKSGFNTEKIWFYGMINDGYSLDVSRKQLKQKPLPQVVNAFKDRLQLSDFDRKKDHFFVSLDDIKNNNFQLSFNQYKSFVYENQEFEDPKILLNKLLDFEKEIVDGLEELKEIL